MPNLGILRRSYADEAAAATERMDTLEARKSELEGIPLPYEMSLYSLIQIYLGAGIEVGDLLSTRASEEVTDESKRTKQLHLIRLECLGLLTRFRETLVQEIEGNESLPRDLEAQVFSYIDTLATKRVGSATSDDKPEEETDANEPGESGFAWG